jgi:hypothetical protein
MQKHVLSKSTFIRGMQCEKSLYLNKHGRNLRDEISPEQMAVFSQGTNVGELAQGLFPGGVDCTPWDSKPILKPFNHKGSCAYFVFVGDTIATQSAFSTTF